MRPRSRHVRELHVEQHGIGRLDGDCGEGFRRVRRFAGDDVPGALQELSRDRAKRLVVVDDQHALHHVAIVAHRCGSSSGFSLESPDLGGIPNSPWDDDRVTTASPPARDSSHRRFRIAVIVASVVAAIIGSVFLAIARLGEGDDARGHRHAGGAGPPRSGDRRPGCALGRAATASREAGRRPAPPSSTSPPGQSAPDREPGWAGFSPGARRRPADCLGPPHDGSGSAPAWSFSTGAAAQCSRRQSLVRYGPRSARSLVRPATSCGRSRNDPGRCCGSTRGRSSRPRLRFDSLPAAPWHWPPAAGYLWVTAADTGEVLRIDPATHAIKRARRRVPGRDRRHRRKRLVRRPRGRQGRPARPALASTGGRADPCRHEAELAGGGRRLAVRHRPGRRDGHADRCAVREEGRAADSHRPAGQRRPRPLGGARRTVRLGEQLRLEHAHSHQLDSRPRRQGRQGNGAHHGYERRRKGPSPSQTEASRAPATSRPRAPSRRTARSSPTGR